MKKILLLMIVLIILLSAITVSANDNIGVFIDGKQIEFSEAQPISSNGRTLIPLRAVAEAMGANVEWNENEQKVVVSKNVRNIEYNGQKYENAQAVGEFKLNNYYITIKLIQDNKEIFNVRKGLDVKANSIDNRTYIPARFVGYALGYNIEWKEPNVYYTFTNEQKTDFEVDKNVRYPEKYIGPDNSVSDYYKGYGNVMIANGDKEGSYIPNEYGCYQIIGDPFSYLYTPISMIFESEDLNVDVLNKEPEENLKNFKTVFEDISREKAEVIQSNDGSYNYNLNLSYSTKDNVTNVGYSDKIITNYTMPEKYQYHWHICNNNVQVDFRNYLYKYGDSYIEGSHNITTLTNGSEKNTLLLLNTFLGETGQKTWQMLHEYFMSSGKQYVAPNTYWNYSTIYKDPINKSIVDMYDLQFVSQEEVEATYYLTIYCPEIKGNLTIKYFPTGPSDGIIIYAIMF